MKGAQAFVQTLVKEFSEYLFYINSDELRGGGHRALVLLLQGRSGPLPWPGWQGAHQGGRRAGLHPLMVHDVSE